MPDARVLVIEARFYEDIAHGLLQGAKACLDRAGAHYDVITVPGALEIAPALAIALDAAISQGKAYDAVVALGCVIRGETGHYDIVAFESARALTELGTARRLPLGNGILTVENSEQAKARADVSGLDKGGAAAVAALTVLKLKQDMEKVG